MAERRALVVGGLALVGLGGLLFLQQQAKPAASSGAAPGPAGPPAQTTSKKPGTGRLLRGSRFYNWSDLRLLPLNPNDPHTWSTGGGTSELGWLPGTTIYWSEARYASANDGLTGWFIRIADRPGSSGGDWALPAADVSSAP